MVCERLKVKEPLSNVISTISRQLQTVTDNVLQDSLLSSGHDHAVCWNSLLCNVFLFAVPISFLDIRRIPEHGIFKLRQGTCWMVSRPRPLHRLSQAYSAACNDNPVFFLNIYINKRNWLQLKGCLTVHLPHEIKWNAKSHGSTIRTVHTTYAAALKTTTHPKTWCRKPYAATQHLMLLMMGACTRNMSSQEHINKIT